MTRDYRLFLDDILEATAKIREYTGDLEYSTFEGLIRTHKNHPICAHEGKRVPLSS